MRWLVATCACLVALMVGAVAVAAAPEPARPPVYDFRLIYSRGGGFAPSTRSLVAAPAQFATVDVTEPTGGKSHVEFRIGGRRIRALERGLHRAHFSSLENPGPSGCADCFEYTIFYRQNYLELDESQMPPRLAAVVAQIEAVIDAHLSAPSTRGRAFRRTP